jgi:uncharacterized protein HemX
MRFLLSILVIIGNLNVLLANNDNCREIDLNAFMVRLRRLRTEFDDFKIKHAELDEANGNQETELKRLRQEIETKGILLKYLF